MAWTSALAALGAAGLLCTACGDSPESSRAGELSAGSFEYRCVGVADAWCEADGVATGFPDALVVGGRFALAYAALGDDRSVSLRVEPASELAIATVGAAFATRRVGFAAMLARDADGAVIDLQHLWIAAPSRIAVVDDDGDEVPRVRMVEGDELELFAEPRDAQQLALGGALDYVWAVDDPGVAEIVAGPYDRATTIEARASGVTRLAVSAAGIETILDVEVTEAGTTHDDEDSGGHGPPGPPDATGTGG